ncbi:SpoIIE family protein phosphatase [Phaeacidiphilus oryzae]|uniref:SpoIIE family protein phosphatase n=1 Tax=Phaeacidiphilus oryzae TaxID=348818 RepID=UPI000690923A|nr:SpoIIE family protein phosphatase [Phaeacidiphilus oryzae]
MGPEGRVSSRAAGAARAQGRAAARLRLRRARKRQGRHGGGPGAPVRSPRVLAEQLRRLADRTRSGPPPGQPHRRRATGVRPYPGGGAPANQPPPAGGSGGGGGTLLDAVSLAIALLDTSGRVVLWSSEAERLLGWPSQALIGRPAAEQLLDEGARNEAAAAREEVMRGQVWIGSMRLHHRDGHAVKVEARVSSLVDGDGVPYLQFAFAEAGALRELEQDLAVRDALFEQSPLGIGLLDRNLRYVRVNGTLARMNGIEPEEHIGRTSGEVLPERAADEAVAIQRQVLATGTPVVDLIIGQAAAGPRGASFQSMSYSRLTDRAGRVLGLTGITMDVTDRYRAMARVEQARQRLSLLNEVGSRIGDLLDVSRIARELAAVLVPRFADYSGVMLLDSVARGGDLPRHQRGREARLEVLGTSAFRDSSRADTMMQPGETVELSEAAEGSAFARVLAGGQAEHLETPIQLSLAGGGEDDPRVRAAIDLGVHSTLVVPLRARGIALGLLVLGRAGRREAFDRDEQAFAVEVADRAGASLENARLYARERSAALMLQRSLLPQTVPQPPGVEVAYRYVPAASGTEVGGDWFDVVPLPRERTALVVGDVMGHSLRAAATMGRLRTAVRTLAGLDLPPAELLQHVHDLADDLAQGPEEALIATVVYAVYDPEQRRLTIASAGHTPPVLVEPTEPGSLNGPLPGGRTRVLSTDSGAPIGVGGVPFTATEFTVAPGDLLMLYTDGLVESRTADIDVGIDRVRRVLERPHASVEEACETVIGTLEQGQEPDDVAVLLARLGGAPQDRTAGWTLPAEPSAVGRARRLLRSTVQEWRLDDSSAETAQLLVSELVTNAVRYAVAPIGLRLIRRPDRLLVEVADPLPDPPRERRAGRSDEGGRGLQLVRRLADQWGTRAQGPGKVVWFELSLPAEQHGDAERPG